MSDTLTWTTPTVPQPPPRDPDAIAVEAMLRSAISLGSVTSPRSRQHAIGASEIGGPCERQLAYRLAGTRPSNLPDPLRPLVGTGVHAALADLFTALDQGSGRYLVETRTSFVGVPGTVDLFDRLTHTVIDWKTTLKAKLSRIVANGPSASHVTQVHTYGAGLAATGERVVAVAIAYVPIDGTLDDLYVWRAPFDVALAGKAAQRISRVGGRQLMAYTPVDPALVTPTPTALCPWCPYYLADALDMSIACNGKESS